MEKSVIGIADLNERPISSEKTKVVAQGRLNFGISAAAAVVFKVSWTRGSNLPSTKIPLI